jgi:hypothetical protein
MDLASIGFAWLTLDVTPVAQSIDQFNGRMVPKLHPLRKHTNCGFKFRRESFYGKQQLVLLAVQTIFPGSVFAECEKCADLVAELRERAIVLRIHLKGLYIALRYLSLRNRLYPRCDIGDHAFGDFGRILIFRRTALSRSSHEGVIQIRVTLEGHTGPSPEAFAPPRKSRRTESRSSFREERFMV